MMSLLVLTSTDHTFDPLCQSPVYVRNNSLVNRLINKKWLNCQPCLKPVKPDSRCCCCPNDWRIVVPPLNIQLQSRSLGTIQFGGTELNLPLDMDAISEPIETINGVSYTNCYWQIPSTPSGAWAITTTEPVSDFTLTPTDCPGGPFMHNGELGNGSLSGEVSIGSPCQPAAGLPTYIFVIVNITVTVFDLGVDGGYCWECTATLGFTITVPSTNFRCAGITPGTITVAASFANPPPGSTATLTVVDPPTMFGVIPIGSMDSSGQYCIEESSSSSSSGE